MKRARMGIIAAAVLAVATVAFAQKTDFSGTWTPTRSRGSSPPAARRRAVAAAAVRGGGGHGRPSSSRRATTMTVERTKGENKVVDGLQARRDRDREQDDGPRRHADRVEVENEVGRQTSSSSPPKDRASGRTSQALWTVEGGNSRSRRRTRAGPMKTTLQEEHAGVGSSLRQPKAGCRRPAFFFARATRLPRIGCLNVHSLPPPPPASRVSSRSRFCSSSPTAQAGDRNDADPARLPPAVRARRIARGSADAGPADLGSSITSSPRSTRSRSSVRGAPGNGRTRPKTRLDGEQGVEQIAC